MAAPCRPPKRPPMPVGEHQVRVTHLDSRMGLAARLAHGFYDLGDAAAIGGMIVAEPAAIRVERQTADA